MTTFPQYDDVTENFVMSKMSFGKFQTGVAFSPRKLIQEKQKSKNRAEPKQYLTLHVWWMPTKSSDFITNDISTVCDIRGASLITSAIIGKLAQTRFQISRDISHQHSQFKITYSWFKIILFPVSQFLRCFVRAGKWQRITDIGGRPAPVLSCHTSSPTSPILTNFSSCLDSSLVILLLPPAPS